MPSSVIARRGSFRYSSSRERPTSGVEARSRVGTVRMMAIGVAPVVLCTSRYNDRRSLRQATREFYTLFYHRGPTDLQLDDLVGSLARARRSAP